MSFLIQDLLDFAQIKEGKFRKNICQFNIREAIEEVMSIQRHAIDQKVIQFTASYENIMENDNMRGSNMKCSLIRKSNLSN